MPPYKAHPPCSRVHSAKRCIRIPPSSSSRGFGVWRHYTISCTSEGGAAPERRREVREKRDQRRRELKTVEGPLGKSVLPSEKKGLIVDPGLTYPLLPPNPAGYGWPEGPRGQHGLGTHPWQPMSLHFFQGKQAGKTSRAHISVPSHGKKTSFYFCEKRGELHATSCYSYLFLRKGFNVVCRTHDT